MSAAIIWVLIRYRSADALLASTMAFTTFVFAQLVNSLIVRSDGRGVFRRHTLTNPALWLTIAAVSAMQVAVVEVPVLQRIFDTVGLTWHQWGLCLAVVAALLVVEEVWIRVRLWIWPDTDLT